MSTTSPEDPAEELRRVLDETARKRLNGLPIDVAEQQEKVREAVREFAEETAKKSKSGKVRLKP